MPVSKGELRYALEQAVRLAYAAFEGYPKPRDMEMSPAKDPRAILRALEDEPLATLSGESLGPYAGSALWTAGDVDDYRHFLPRILVLALQNAPWTGFEPQTIAAKLKFAAWDTWPESERRAIIAVFMAGWPFVLTRHPHKIEASLWLEGMAELGMDTSDALAIWQDSPFPEAALQCADFIFRSASALAKGRVVIDGNVTAWLRSKELADGLFAAAVEASFTPEERETLARACDVLESLPR